MSRYRVLITDGPFPDWSIEEVILSEIGAELIVAPSGDEATLIELARDADAIGTCWAHVTGAVIEAASRCKVVARFGIGLDNIAVDVATSRGIIVTNVPDYCISEVADHTLAALLMFARRLHRFPREMKAGTWSPLAGRPPLRRLSEQTLGVIGLGRTGQAVIRRASAFDLRCIAWSRSKKDIDCEQVSREELFERSDYIALCVPLTPETRWIINTETLSQMKPTAYLINTSRGGLVDADAVLHAIEDGRLAGAALDVFEPEPPDMNSALVQHPDVVPTPHAAFVSVEALHELRRRASWQIRHVLTGERPENIVNGL